MAPLGFSEGCTLEHCVVTVAPGLALGRNGAAGQTGGGGGGGGQELRFHVYSSEEEFVIHAVGKTEHIRRNILCLQCMELPT